MLQIGTPGTGSRNGGTGTCLLDLDATQDIHMLRIPDTSLQDFALLLLPIPRDTLRDLEVLPKY